MASEKDKIKMRSLKSEILEESELLQDIVDGLCIKYDRELTKYIGKVKDLIDNKEQLTNLEMEDIAIRVPIYMYYAVEGVEDLGIAYDNSKLTYKQKYSEMYQIAKGTIKDKESYSEEETVSEQMLEIAFKRAYKKLKAKLDICEALMLSVRKIIGKRTQEMFIASQEKD